MSDFGQIIKSAVDQTKKESEVQIGSQHPGVVIYQNFGGVRVRKDEIPGYNQIVDIFEKRV